MSDLGQLLRKARMEQKISIEDLQETTKIRKRYLEAIEEGNYKVLPGNFYVRAFIKSYAEAVGLDPNEVLNMYQNVIPAAEPDHIEPIRSKRTGRNTEKIGKWVSNVMMISFVILILGIIYYFVNINYNSKQQEANPVTEPNRVTDKVDPNVNSGTPAVPVTDIKTEPVPTPPPPVPVPVNKSDVKLVKSQNGTDYYTVSNTDKLTILMNITGEACWIQIDSIGDTREMLEQGTYTKGKSQTWELTNSAFMIFGRSNAVELNVNGTIIALGDTPNAKRVQIDLQKI
ncbi:helix-turn-helix domain-containing protein [Paenibacillus agricola]|uniref:Helix-turn-helix domain-containing protein n=1 Tax=Paenibacillus agricola TaxID=2716264 RepID=A0ABX0IWM7_9BACL|nr:RodZ domain-containing protein [Paenibacillus agricola]NHN28312.1 helix-turn-helix domain-containing protein [Paenibacillus agricola]